MTTMLIISLCLNAGFIGFLTFGILEEISEKRGGKR